MDKKLASPAHIQPESPTTSREPDFDDTPDVSELSIHPRGGGGDTTPSLGSRSLRASVEDDRELAGETTPTSAPGRTLPPQLLVGLSSPEGEALSNLAEAFPDIDVRVVKAVLRAGEFRTERAFEALLEYSDPNYVIEEEEAPPPPPRPSQQSQMETDEELARRLAAEYDQLSRERSHERPPRLPQRNQPRDQDDERESSFFDDELPKIGKQIQQGFFETQTKFNKFLTDFKKRIDGAESDEDDHNAREYESRYGQSSAGHNFDEQQSAYGQIYGNNAGGGGGGRGQGAGSRNRNGGAGTTGFGSERSNSLHRNPNYDADPRVLDPDELYGETVRSAAASPSGSALKMPGAPSRVKSPGVTFADVPIVMPTAGAKAGSGDGLGLAPASGSGSGSGNKWQPLNQMPQPNRDRERDPFELGDSDDEDGPAGAAKAGPKPAVKAGPGEKIELAEDDAPAVAK